jgi:hypothetical protein
MTDKGKISRGLSKLYKLTHTRLTEKSPQELSGGFEGQTSGGSE